MGTTIRLTAADGHVLSAYQAEPAGTPRGAVVVLQEVPRLAPRVHPPNRPENVQGVHSSLARLR